MKYKILILMSLIAIVGILPSCNVHEWPSPEDKETLVIHLDFSTDFPIYQHNLSTRESEAANLSKANETVDNGFMRYNVRLYPIVGDEIASENSFFEYSEISLVQKKYDRDIVINITPGSYRVMVWADLRETQSENHFYDLSDYHEIKLTRHVSNTDFRDCFRGSTDIYLPSTFELKDPYETTVSMERPVAKFEFISNDLEAFLDKELADANLRSQVETENLSTLEVTRAPELSDYKVKFYYVGFMPSTYSMLTDKPTDSTTGNAFEGKIVQLSSSEASLGFDYIYTGLNENYTTIRIGLENKEGDQLSLSDAIQVPIKRSNHTIVTGSFLMTESSGGVGINPDYDGDFNIIFP